MNETRDYFTGDTAAEDVSDAVGVAGYATGDWSTWQNIEYKLWYTVHVNTATGMCSPPKKQVDRLIRWWDDA